MSAPATVVSVGADLFATAVADQAVPVTSVDWRPPMPGTEADLAVVATDPLRKSANELPSRGCSTYKPCSSTSGRRPTYSRSRGGRSCTPARRSGGIARPARSAVR